MSCAISGPVTCASASSYVRKRRITLRRQAHGRQRRIGELGAALVHVHVVGDPHRAGVAQERLDAREIEIPGRPAERPVDVVDRRHLDPHEDVQSLSVRLDEHADRRIGRNIVGGRRARQSEQADGQQQRPDCGDSSGKKGQDLGDSVHNTLQTFHVENRCRLCILAPSTWGGEERL